MDYKLITTATGISGAISSFEGVFAVGLDMETTALNSRDGKIRLIQMSDGEQNNYIIDVFKLDNADALQLLVPFLEAEKPRKVIHNSKFEIHWTQTVLGCEINGVFDTWLAAKLIDMPLNGKLNEVLEKHLGIAMSKEEQRSDWSGNLTESQLQYAMADAYHLPRLRKKLINDLIDDDMTEVAQIEFKCTPAIASMEYAGLPIDIPMYKALVEKLIERRDIRHEELQEVLNAAMGEKEETITQGGLFGEDTKIKAGGINLNSPAQVKEAFGRLGVELPSTGKQIVNKMVGSHPQLKYLTNYRAEQILVTSFGQKVIDCVRPDTGRIHASFLQLKPATGRFACINPNLQQMPHDEEFRECFRPTDPNRCFIICDYSQIELRILAQLAKDKVMIDAFKSGIDIHSLVAKNTYNLPCDVREVKDKFKKERGNAKSLVFGIVYGMGANKYADQVGVSVKEARHAIDTFSKTYPDVAKWFTVIESQGVKDRGVRTLAGRRLKFYFDPMDGMAVSMARRNSRNSPIQGLSADILKTALALVYEAIKPYDASLVNIVHDEIIIEANRSEAQQIGYLLSSCMVKAGEIYLTDVPVSAESDIGNSWADKS